MAEGDFSIQNLLKKLPSLPAGKYWTREPDGSWIISGQPKKFKINLEEVQLPPSLDDAFIEHVVMPEDTIVGICLKYKVSKKELHRHNDFFGDHFKLCKVLRIPNKFADSAQIAELQPHTRDVVLQHFKNETGLGYKEATFYLENNDWNYNLALRQFEGDREWECTHVEGSIAAVSLKKKFEKQKYPEPTNRSAGAAMAITGTSGADFLVSDDGTIEMISNNAGIPLLSGVASSAYS